MLHAVIGFIVYMYIIICRTWCYCGCSIILKHKYCTFIVIVEEHTIIASSQVFNVTCWNSNTAITIISDEYPRTCIGSATERIPVIDSVDKVMLLLIFILLHAIYMLYRNWHSYRCCWMDVVYHIELQNAHANRHSQHTWMRSYIINNFFFKFCTLHLYKINMYNYVKCSPCMHSSHHCTM